jgi:predicted RNA binding protein YcfA (HicA-like mRNA interferase family)
MATYRKLLERVLSGRSDANIRFDDLRNLLARLGFGERSRGSHPFFIHPSIRFDRFELSSPSTGWIKKGTINA